MKKIVLSILALTLILPLLAVIEETASFRQFLIGNAPTCAYDKWISHLAEGIVTSGYNTYAPYDTQTTGFGNFVTASTTQLTQWGSIVDLFLTGELDLAQEAVTSAGFPYQVVLFHDSDTGRTYRMLREIPDSTHVDTNGTVDDYDDEIGAFDYGWGLYIFNPDGVRPVVVTAPHPCDDFPTPQFAYEAFKTWDAQFMLIAGAGREVKWTQVGSYTNAKSLSDPTRVSAHPFNVAYAKFCDTIRTEFTRREFSAQIHTYDWNYHAGYPNTQISAGYNRLCPNLPIRDLSSLKLDLINHGNHVMIPANTVGFNREVLLNDFYGVNYDTYDFTFNDGEHEYPVNDYIDLPAYSQNYQMNYTLSNWTDYDIFDPFFHMEMDELPNSYDLTTNNYKWFYGWNENDQRWDFDNLFTHFNEYYMRWVYDMDETMTEMFAMNDNLIPPAPTNLAVENQSLNHITLSWTKTDSYDFDSYEVLYATEPIGESNYQVFNRNNAAILASPYCQSVSVTNLSNANVYYFKIRAKDKNGNLSPLSNEVMSLPAPANIYSFNAYGMDNAIRLNWAVAGQTNNQGFKIYRKPTNGEYTLLDSYVTNPNLTNPTGTNFEYWDYNVQNNAGWTYRLSSTNINNVEFYYNYPASAEARAIHRIYISNAAATLRDSINFAVNPFASDGQDTYYDVSKANPSGSNYVWNAFWEQYWGNSGTQLAREIKADYDLDNDIKTWVMRVSSNQLNTPLFISASNDFNRAEKLYLYDSGTWTNLFQNSYQFTLPNTNVRTMTLYWGNLQPKVTFGSVSNRLYQGGSTVSFYWSNQNSFLIDHINLYLKNDTDSLFVASGLSSSTSSFNFSLPTNITMFNARIYADVYAVDGLVKTYNAGYSIGIIPLNNSVSCEAGWQTRGKPWSDAVTVNVSDVFGPGATGLIASADGTWLPQSVLWAGNAYWVDAPSAFTYTSSGPINPTELIFPLVTGWNFIPNAHFCSYPLSAMRFTVNGTQFQFSEMIQQELVSRGVYVYRQGKYQLVDTVNPSESFFIKYYGNASLLGSISLYPFNSATSITPPPGDWQLHVAATTAQADTDQFTIGTNGYGTDSYDFYFDLPVAPAKPFPSVRLYSTHANPPEEQYLDQNLGEDVRAKFGMQQQEEKLWNFALEAPVAGLYTINLSSLNFPQGFSIRVILNGQNHTYGPNDSFTTTFDQAGTYYGQVIVYNHIVANSDELMPAISSATVYPNPFNPSTTISFSTPRAQAVNVELYNLRGQKVCNLHHGDLPGGTHHLQWNGRDEDGRPVASGMYFVRISTPDYTRSLKMVLMK